MLPQRSGMHEHAPGGSERREAVPRHLTGGFTTDGPRCLLPTAGNRVPPAHADEAVVRRLWQTVRWLPVCASRAPEPAPVGGGGVLARRRGSRTASQNACWSASTDPNRHRSRMPANGSDVPATGWAAECNDPAREVTCRAVEPPGQRSLVSHRVVPDGGRPGSGQPARRTASSRTWRTQSERDSRARAAAWRTAWSSSLDSRTRSSGDSPDSDSDGRPLRRTWVRASSTAAST